MDNLTFCKELVEMSSEGWNLLSCLWRISWDWVLSTLIFLSGQLHSSSFLPIFILNNIFSPDTIKEQWDQVTVDQTFETVSKAKLCSFRASCSSSQMLLQLSCMESYHIFLPLSLTDMPSKKSVTLYNKLFPRVFHEKTFQNTSAK